MYDMLPGGTNAAENGADVRFGPDTPVRWRDAVWQDYSTMLVVVMLPVMLRDSSPFTQYIRGQEDGWRRTCVGV
jgi:hypothetical protein